MLANKVKTENVMLINCHIKKVNKFLREEFFFGVYLFASKEKILKKKRLSLVIIERKMRGENNAWRKRF